MYRAMWNCTELLKANDRVLLTIETFVHVLILSKHSVLGLVFSVLCPRIQQQKLLLLIDHRCT